MTPQFLCWWIDREHRRAGRPALLARYDLVQSILGQWTYPLEHDLPAALVSFIALPWSLT